MTCFQALFKLLRNKKQVGKQKDVVLAKKPKQKVVKTPKKDVTSEGAKEAVAFIHKLHKLETVSIFDQVLHPQAEVLFRGALMSRNDFVEQSKLTFEAFPDFQHNETSIRVVVEKDGYWEIVCEIKPSGTHTGIPYAFGPFPEIPTTGKHVQMDPERLTYTVTAQEGGKGLVIQKMSILPLGAMTGPAGFYTAIGGVIF